MYPRRPPVSSKRTKRAWVYPPERPEKSSPTERSTVLGTSSFKPRIDETRSSTAPGEASSLTSKNTRWSTIALFPWSRSYPRSLAGRLLENAALRLLYLVVVDRGVAAAHQAVLVELPQLVTVATPPLSILVVGFVLEPDRDAVFRKAPEVLLEPV